ncbi:MAG: GntR family transcriptional regulator [Spirochaetes bacterium]|nr:GntR family transcriptional regulator [Spirochaetota bacterium]
MSGKKNDRQYEQIYQHLRKRIIEGDYYPSERLIEKQLAEEYKTGRYNIRLALQKLQGEGLVIIEPHKGARIAELSLEDIMDILVAREELEVAVVRLAIQNITDGQCERLEECIRLMGKALSENNFDTYSQMNLRFHRTIYEACGNRSLSLLIEMLRSRLARLQLRTILIPGRSEESLAEHQRIFEAFRKRDPVLAEQSIRTHMGNLRINIQKAWSLVKF